MRTAATLLLLLTWDSAVVAQSYAPGEKIEYKDTSVYPNKWEPGTFVKMLPGSSQALIRKKLPAAPVTPTKPGAPPPDGREPYHVPPDSKPMAADLEPGADSVAPSTPRELFAVSAGGSQPYAVAPDGKRFLVRAPVGSSQPLDVVVNWTALLKQGASPE